MSETVALHVVAADRIDGAVIISFSDGRCGLFSAALLYNSLPQAKELFEQRKKHDPALETEQRPKSHVFD